MSALSPHVRALEALGRAAHAEAERRMPRPGRIAPERNPQYENALVALILGSFAQICEGAAVDLKQQIADDIARMKS